MSRKVRRSEPISTICTNGSSVGHQTASHDDGIIAFVTNRAYLEARQDDGFRQVVGKEFSDLYILDLRSDVRRNPKIAGTTHNVFGIQTGVAIGFFVRDSSKAGPCGIHYAHIGRTLSLPRTNLTYLRDAKTGRNCF